MSKELKQKDYIKKIFVTSGTNASLKVPFKEITQTGDPKDNPPLRIYDTSGPLGDKDFKASLEGIPKLRASWVANRKGDNVSQMHFAKQGIITEEMEYVATRENELLKQAETLGIKSPYASNLPDSISCRQSNHSCQYQAYRVGAHHYRKKFPR